ncbi:uncharacterized protein I206_101078 [Kwoniella pini CBS 10737]|uniref:B30.2/SPRY domain-containing protein n=1 Tax=Kwoniella pini CBS 10737 TaxID=1296096 RepID=A0A1B9IBB1_9TREE|nr:uncharacterized protein I206_00249 [Kwoniella pini CBS 10737]OCF52948.1 hypothetical protein I206_00249 [Kwoniella pini CBS 10737]
MPPHRGGRNSPPVDPFPPLRRAGSSSSSNPSYASIAARSSHPQRYSSHEAGPAQRSWGTEDVDRQDNLDELNIHSHAPYAEPIDINPSPPWRSRTRRRSDHTSTEVNEAAHSLPEREGQSSRNRITATPSGSTQSRTITIANGARNPPSDSGEGISTPPQLPARPSNHSPPSPSPTHRTREQPSPSATRLAPMFTLEELLRTNPDRTEETTTNTNNTTSSSQPRRRADAATIRAHLQERRNERERASEPLPWGMRMERALPTGAGSGNRETTGSSSLDAVFSLFDDSNEPIVIPFPADNGGPSSRTITRMSGVPLDGSGNNNNPSQDASQAITSFLRRRRRNPAPVRPVTTVWDPAEILPADYLSGPILPSTNELDLEDEEDVDSEEERWASRLRIHNFSDVDLGSIVPGNQALHRGGNNRRRMSFLERIGAPSDLRFPEEFEERMDFPPPTRGVNEATGCEPTNRNLAENITPLVVRSGGVIRPRDASKTSSPVRKKQRPNPRYDDTPASPSRPAYLDISTLSKNVALPSSFIPPLRRSHLAVSTYKSGNTIRPLITFVGCNPKRIDEDATSLHTTTPIPIECGVHYYEVEVIDRGEEGFMSVGWMKKGTNLRRLVGWDKGSWGWHGDDGRSFEGQGRGERFSETWTTGDIVGCGIDFTTGQAFFTKNGKMMGHRFSNLSKGLNPAIGLRSVGESLSVNFDGPFKFDIASYVESTKNGIWSLIKNTDVESVPRLVDQIDPSTSKSTPLTAEDADLDSSTSTLKRANHKMALAKALEKELKEYEVDDSVQSTPDTSSLVDPIDKTTSALVLDYLQHNGHSSVLSTLRNAMVKRGRLPDSSRVIDVNDDHESTKKTPSELALSHFTTKQEALNWVHTTISGSFENLLPARLIQDLSLSSLPSSALFTMELYDFLHLLHLSALPTSSDDDFQNVLEKGKSIRSELVNWPLKEKTLAEKAFGLLGQPDELNDPFWAAKRTEWADGLVRILREANGLNQSSQLEHAIRQSSAVMKTLSAKNGKSGAAFIDVKRIFE